jgi:hypothetical protein
MECVMDVKLNVSDELKEKIVSKMLSDGANKTNKLNNSIEALVSILILKYINNDIDINLSTEFDEAFFSTLMTWGKHKSICPN